MVEKSIILSPEVLTEYPNVIPEAVNATASDFRFGFALKSVQLSLRDSFHVMVSSLVLLTTTRNRRLTMRCFMHINYHLIATYNRQLYRHYIWRRKRFNTIVIAQYQVDYRAFNSPSRFLNHHTLRCKPPHLYNHQIKTCCSETYFRHILFQCCHWRLGINYLQRLGALKYQR